MSNTPIAQKITEGKNLLEKCTKGFYSYFNDIPSRSAKDVFSFFLGFNSYKALEVAYEEYCRNESVAESSNPAELFVVEKLNQINPLSHHETYKNKLTALSKKLTSNKARAINEISPEAAISTIHHIVDMVFNEYFDLFTVNQLENGEIEFELKPSLSSSERQALDLIKCHCCNKKAKYKSSNNQFFEFKAIVPKSVKDKNYLNLDQKNTEIISTTSEVEESHRKVDLTVFICHECTLKHKELNPKLYELLKTPYEEQNSAIKFLEPNYKLPYLDCISYKEKRKIPLPGINISDIYASLSIHEKVIQWQPN